MTKFVHDEGHNRFEAYSKGETDAAIASASDLKNIAAPYNSTATYNVGDYCIYDTQLYVCNHASTTGTFNPNYWDAITVTNAIKTLNNNKANKTDIPFYHSPIKKSMSTNNISFTLDHIDDGFIFILGECNGNPFSLQLAVHGSAIRTTGIINQGYSITNVAVNGLVVTLTLPNWSTGQAFSNIPIT